MLNNEKAKESETKIIPEEINKDDLNEKNSSEIGTAIIEKVLKIPRVKVDRDKFLRGVLDDKISPTDLEKAIKEGTYNAGIPLKIIQEAAKERISLAQKASTIESSATGLPGGLAGILVGVSADIIQFYANLCKLIQELMYLYGMKDIKSWSDIKDNDKTCAQIILIFIGAATGAESAEAAIKIILKVMQNQYNKGASKLILLSKPAFYSIAKKIAKSIGMGISKKGFAKAASKAVPIIGAGVSAVINWVAFSPLAKNLDKKLSEIYDKPFDEKVFEQLKTIAKENNYFVESAESIKKYSQAYHKNKKTVKDRKNDNLSQECLEFIKELCDEAVFFKPDESVFKLVNVSKDNCFACHDDTKKSHTRGFVITADGIHSFIDPKRQYRFISFIDFAEITDFSLHKHKSPLNSHKFIEARKDNVELIPLLPYEKIPGGSKTIIPFLRAIRNACWVDLYL